MSILHPDPYPIAEALGLVVVLPAPNELFLDIDDAESLAMYEARIVDLREHYEVVETKRTTSNGGNTHIYLALRDDDGWVPLDAVTRIALQACLGSDRQHELLSLMTAHAGSLRPPTVLFEKPE